MKLYVLIFVVIASNHIHAVFVVTAVIVIWIVAKKVQAKICNLKKFGQTFVKDIDLSRKEIFQR